MKAKRVLASLLTAALIITGLPVTAFAADAEKEWWSDDYSTYFYYVNGELKESPTKVDKTIKANCETGTITVYKATAEDAEGATVEVEADDALGHIYEKGLKGPSTATCEKAGVYHRICDRCGKEEEKETKEAALGHLAAEKPVKENVVEGDCETPGSYDEVIYCTRENCDAKNHEISRTTITTEGKHQWKQETTEEKKPTCTEAGSVTITKTCEVCGKVETETITTDPLGHKWELTKEIKKATCGKDGEGLYTCSVCKATETRPIEATGKHKFERKPCYTDDRFMSPTCTEPGTIVTYSVCSVCGEEEDVERIVEPADPWYHEYTDKHPETYDHPELIGESAYELTSTTASCTLRGQSIYTCKLCGDVKKVYEGPFGHTPELDKKGNPIIVKENITKPATCTEDGKEDITYRCARCGEEYVEKDVVIEATDHDLLDEVKEVVKAATCEEDGTYVMVQYCKNCKKPIVKSEEMTEPALDHKYGDAPIEQTCQGALYKCERCGKLEKRDEPIEHTWKLTKTTKEPTCTEPGTGVYKCDFCNKTETRDLDPLGHDWTQLVKKATCTEDGEAGGTCRRCKIMSDHEVIPALGHTFDGSNTTAKVYWDAGVKGKGYILYTTVCSNGCKEKREQVEYFDALEFAEDDESNEIKEDGEVTLKLMKDGEETTVKVPYTVKLTREVTKEATCEAPGERTYTATVVETLPSGKIIAESTSWTEKDIKATEHTFGEAVKEKVVEADCGKGKDGSYELVVKCSVCGKELSRKKVTVKAEHTWPEKPVKENEQNYDSDTLPYKYDLVWYCTVCGKELDRIKDVTFEKNGHVAAEPVKENVVEPDCKNNRDGKYDLVWYCKDCDPKVEMYRVKDIVIPADHEFEHQLDVLQEPTCTEKGLGQEVYRCVRCGEVGHVHDPEEIDALGHSAFFTKTVVTKAATCTEEGASAEVTYCGVCFEEIKRSEEKAVDALGHKALNPVKENEVAATCTEDGSYDEVVYCAVCGEEISRETKTVPALGHTAMEAVKENEVAATCTEDGSYDEVVYCEVCNEEISRETKTVESEGHKWDAGVVIKEATPDEKGEMKYTCTVCGETKTEEIDNSGLVKKESTIVLNNKLVYYNGKVQAFDATDAKVNGSKGAVTFEYFSDSKCTNKISAPTNCGNYYAKATVAADAEYAEATSSVAKLRILRVYQGFSVAGKTVTVSAASLKSANQTIPQSKAVTLRKGNDQVKFVKAIWTYNSPITVDKAGNIQLRKGLKAGTYTVKCKAYTPASRNYLRTVKVYTVTIKVK